jgi:hypothetical protein
VSDERTGDLPEKSDEARPRDVLALRVGHGANCSSVGSVIDTLFATAAVGSALFAAVLAALAEEPVKIAGERDDEEPPVDEVAR